MKLKFDVTAAEYGIMRDVLSAHLAADCRVWVFGSRAKHSTRFNSDCDLAIECTTPLPQQTRIALNEAFDDAKLAFSVDIVDMKTVEPYFKQIIDSHKVEFPLARKAPSLRFPEFSGEWERSVFKQLVKLQRGSSPRPIVKFVTKSDDGVNWIKIGDTKLSDIYINSTSEKITQEGALKSRKVHSGEIILSNSMSYGKPYILNIEGCIHDGWFVIRNYENSFVKNYLYQLLASDWIQKQYKRLAAGGVVDNISSDLVNAVEINLPTLPEQTKIAAFLSSVDTKIDQLSQKKALLEQYKKGVMQQIFSQQIRFKADDGSDYPEWEEKKLGEVALVNPKSSQLPDEFFYIDLESVEKGKLLKYNLIDKIDAPSRAQRLLQKQDVIFQMVRPYQGNNYFFDLDDVFVASTGYAQIRTSHNAKYIYHFLHTEDFVTDVINRCTGSSYPAINSNDLADILVQLPCLEEQTKIANFLSAIDSKIEQVAQQLKAAKQFKKGLLQQMFV